MKKLLVRGIFALAILLGGVYIFTPTSSVSASTKAQNTNNGHYVGLESKVSKLASTDDINVPEGFSIKISQEARSSGVLGNFEEAIKDRYINDGNVEVYIAQGTGVQGSQEQVIYDVNINGKEYMNLTATRTVKSDGFTGSFNMTPIVFSGK